MPPRSATLRAPQLRVLQILVLAMVMGVVIFAVIATQIAPVANTPANLGPLRVVGVALLVACLSAAIGIKWVMGARQRAARDNPFAYRPDEAARWCIC